LRGVDLELKVLLSLVVPGTQIHSADEFGPGASITSGSAG
jgi:hypothetical protein